MLHWRPRRCLANNCILRYLLADHLGTLHGDASATDTIARPRYLPFDSDLLVSGANDLAQAECSTGQRRVEVGGGNARRELYHYGARAYLPGVGIFTQPDTIVPDQTNPQALNRYTYVFNNPLKYVDSNGQFPLPGDGMSMLSWLYAASGILRTLPFTSLPNPLYAEPIEGPRVEGPRSAADTTRWLVDRLKSNAGSYSVAVLRFGYFSAVQFWKALSIRGWTRMVRSGGVWDFKVEMQQLPETTVPLGKRQLNYQAVANIHYGFVGRAIGHRSEDLLVAAGLAQVADHGWDSPNVGSRDTHFDDPFDNWSIRFGIYLYEVYGDNLCGLTPEAFTAAMEEFIEQYGEPPAPLNEG